MTETKPRWDVGVGYDPRFGDLLLQPACPHGEKGAVKHVPLAAVIKTFGIRSSDLRTATRDARAGLNVEISSGIGLEATRIATCLAALPDTCSGSVLDIGGYDGRYGAVCLDRGAEEVICLDSQQYLGYGWDQPEPLPGVIYRTGNFEEDTGSYDLVLFFNVAYHIKNPWQGFEHLRRLVQDRLALVSLVTQDDQDTWRICAPFEVNPEDETVYWVPSETGLIKLLHNVGFEHVTVVGKAGDRLAVTAS